MNFESNRRDVLRVGAAAGVFAGLGGWGFAQDRQQPGAGRTAATAAEADAGIKHVIFIAMAGGVRTRETFGMPGNVPNLTAMANEGVLYPKMRTSNLGHFGATMSIFTGISEARGIRDNARGTDPTIFEYLRKELGLKQSDVWVTTSGGPQQTNYSYSVHPDYGAKYGANTLDGDGIFNKEFKDLLDAYGRPRVMEDSEQELLDALRKSIGRKQDAAENLEAAENAAKVEKYILDELTRGTSDLTGAGSGDGKALRVARNLVSLFKPKLTGVVLQNADVAHGSFDAYSEVIRRNDAAIGEIWTAVKEDPLLANSTAIFVLPEFGRDKDLNSRRGLDHGDGSDDLRYVSGVAWGPTFAKGRVVKDDVRTIDAMYSACDSLGAKPEFAKGHKLKRLLA
jgi:hypothetical protein